LAGRFNREMGRYRQKMGHQYERRVGYRPRRSGGIPTVAQPEGPNAHELEIVTALHPEALAYVEEAVTMILKQKCGELERPEVWLNLVKAGLVKRRVDPVCAEQIVAGFVDHVLGGDWLDWKTMLNVVRDIAIANPRYYGITDPMTQQYCAKCRKVKKLNDFPPSRIRCYDCGTWEEDQDASV